MFRYGALKFGAATGLAAATASGKESQARVRPARLARTNAESRETDSATAASVEDLSDNWLPFDLDGDKVIFEREEIRESIQDMLSLRDGGFMNSSSDTESIESFGRDADTVIANSGGSSSAAIDSLSGIGTLAKFTEGLLSRPAIQKEVLEAIHHDPGMYMMFNQLAQCNGADIQLPPTRYQSLPTIEAPPEPTEGNIFEKFVQKIGQIVEEAGSDVSRAGDAAGKFLRKFGRWIKGRIQKEAEQAPAGHPNPVEVELHPAEKAVGAAICMAGAVVVIIVAKRMGLLRFIRL